MWSLFFKISAYLLKNYLARNLLIAVFIRKNLRNGLKNTANQIMWLDEEISNRVNNANPHYGTGTQNFAIKFSVQVDHFICISDLENKYYHLCLI